MATGIIMNDSKKLYSDLINWSKTKGEVNPRLRILSYIMPVIFGSVGLAYVLTMDPRLSYITIFLFLTNLSILYSNYKVILNDVLKADKVHESILNYSKILVQIENRSFSSERLIELQNRLKGNKIASREIGALSSLFGSLISIQNAMASVIINGIALYHLHAYHALLKWKNEHGAELEEWLKVIGEFEALNSLSNFSHILHT